MPVKSLDDLFLHTLKDILYAERQILKALPKMEEKASAEKLGKAFADHRQETEGQIERLEQIFQKIGQSARGEKCEAIEGIIKEAEGLMDEIDDPETLDAALIASAQAVEHYELTRYGTLIAWAKELGQDEYASLLEKNLDEEYAADRLLSALAEARLNQKAA